MSKDKQNKTNAVNFTIWTMDGGPLPEKVMRRLEGAVLSIIKDTENHSRLLHTVTKE